MEASSYSSSLSSSSGGWVSGEQLVLLFKAEAKQTLSALVFSSFFTTVFPLTSSKGEDCGSPLIANVFIETLTFFFYGTGPVKF